MNTEQASRRAPLARGESLAGGAGRLWAIVLAGGEGVRLRPQGAGLSIPLVEQNAKLVFDIAANIVTLKSGRVAVQGSAAELLRSGIDLRQNLGIY